MVGVFVVVVTACAGGALPSEFNDIASLLPPGGSSEPTELGDPEDTPYSGPAAGSWSGTITIQAVIDHSTTEDGSSGDPGSAYYQTYTTNEQTQIDATDTFTISAEDPDDLTYGIRRVALEGPASNSGSTLERYVTTWDKQNSACTWNEEIGQETRGSWSASGDSVGELTFSEDGTYSITIRADSSDEAEVAKRTWLTYSNISANCETNFAAQDRTEPSSPIIHWASQKLGDADLDGFYAYIDGQLDAANPGSVVEGTSTWEIRFPEGLTLTASWRLEHSGPIILPHS